MKEIKKKHWEPVQALDRYSGSLVFYLITVILVNGDDEDDDTFMTSLNITYYLNYTDKLLFEGY